MLDGYVAALPMTGFTVSAALEALETLEALRTLGALGASKALVALGVWGNERGLGGKGG